MWCGLACSHDRTIQWDATTGLKILMLTLFFLNVNEVPMMTLAGAQSFRGVHRREREEISFTGYELNSIYTIYQHNETLSHVHIKTFHTIHGLVLCG
jgi:hypothetical protein